MGLGYNQSTKQMILITARVSGCLGWLTLGLFLGLLLVDPCWHPFVNLKRKHLMCIHRYARANTLTCLTLRPG
jgi:hypothetical protein